MDDAKQKNVNDFLTVMLKSALSEQDIKNRIIEYLVPTYSCGFRHSYSQIFATINQNIDSSASLGILTDNMEILKSIIDDTELSQIKDSLLKLHDHTILEISRINYFNKMVGKTKSINKEIGVVRDALGGLNKDLREAADILKNSKEEVNSLKSEIITVLSIFAAIMLGSIGGISFIGNVMSSLNNTSIYRILLMTNVAGFIVFNLVFSLLYIASRMLQRNIYSKCKTENGENDCDCGKCGDNCWSINRIRRRLPYVFWVNVIILLMIGLTILDWKYRLIGYKFLQ